MRVESPPISLYLRVWMVLLPLHIDRSYNQSPAGAHRRHLCRHSSLHRCDSKAQTTSRRRVSTHLQPHFQISSIAGRDENRPLSASPAQDRLQRLHVPLPRPLFPLHGDRPPRRRSNRPHFPHIRFPGLFSPRFPHRRVSVGGVAGAVFGGVRNAEATPVGGGCSVGAAWVAAAGGAGADAGVGVRRGDAATGGGCEEEMGGGDAGEGVGGAGVG